MKISAQRSPVEMAIAGYEALLVDARSGDWEKLPTERELAERWKLSQAAVNRAASQLVAAGRLRREGYKLVPAGPEGATIMGARVAVLTHRTLCFPGLEAEAARLGIHLEELFFSGRDTLRNDLRKAASRRVDGVVMRLSEGGWEWDAEMAEFNRFGIPCVVCDEAPAGHAITTEDWRSAGSSLVAHLAAKGHTDIAFIGSLRHPKRSTLIRDAYTEACLGRGLTAASSRTVEAASHTLSAVATAFVRLREQWPQTTAVVLYDVSLLPALLGALRGAELKIPEDISVVAVGDSAAARDAQPGITCSGFDQRAIGHLALDQICQQILHQRRFGRLPPARMRLRMESVLVERTSVQTRADPSASAVSTSGPESRLPHVWSQDRATRLREAETVSLSPHALAHDANIRDFAPLDLRPLATRSLIRQHGWLGNHPLLHLPTGPQTIHGVPFDVIDEKHNQGLAAIVLRAQRSHAHSEHPLPFNLTVPVGRRVRAVYFFHGCGNVGEPMAFAWYDFMLENKRPLTVPLVTKGMSPPAPDVPPPNIQDWWSDYPQFEAPGVKHAVVTAHGDPFEYERYLYTLEWVNPHPQHKLREIRISSNPTQPTTLGVLAITLLLA